MFFIVSLSRLCSAITIDNRPPGMVRAKGNYMGKDLSRLSLFYQIPLHMPSVSYARLYCNTYTEC